MAAFVLNLYLGDVNPGTSEGLNLCNKAVDAPLDIKQSHVGDVLATFEKDANNFGWGAAVSSVQADNIISPTTKSILPTSREINLTSIQKPARCTWGSPTGLNWVDLIPAALTVFNTNPVTNAAQRPQFFHITRSLMISKLIEATPDKGSPKYMMLSMYQWTSVGSSEVIFIQ